MNKKNADSPEKAKAYAFLLLKFRQRSEKELEQRLKRKKFSEEIIRKTVEFLREKEFLNDNLFAKSWIESRIKRPFGLRRIKEELKVKGIDKQIIEEKISEVKENYSEEAVVEQLARMRLGKLKGIQALAVRRRVYAYLIRRGFSPEAVTEVINQLCKQTY